jgi:hypothetical protein
LIEHDLFGKPLHTFPDHALEIGKADTNAKPRSGGVFVCAFGSVIPLTAHGDAICECRGVKTSGIKPWQTS